MVEVDASQFSRFPRRRSNRSQEFLTAIRKKNVPMTATLSLPTLGITEIDRQHRQLLNCLDDLEASVRKGYGLAGACAAILSLEDYVSRHFHYEERFLRSHVYPKLDEHIEEHRKIRAQVAMYTQQVTEGGDVSLELCLLLREWIITHIGIDDAEYAKLLRSSAWRPAGPLRSICNFPASQHDVTLTTTLKPVKPTLSASSNDYLITFAIPRSHPLRIGKVAVARSRPH